MDCAPNIDHAVFPVQSAYLHQCVRVCFHYDTTLLVGGIVVRDDATEPWVTIVRLDDGRHVLGTECQWSPRPMTRTERRAYGRRRDECGCGMIEGEPGTWATLHEIGVCRRREYSR